MDPLAAILPKEEHARDFAELEAAFDWLAEHQPWRTQARCRTVPDIAMFFPARGSPGDEAKSICARCPVRIECLEYALKHGERYGVWGGLTERERTRLQRKTSYLRAQVTERTSFLDVLEQAAPIRTNRRHPASA